MADPRDEPRHGPVRTDADAVMDSLTRESWPRTPMQSNRAEFVRPGLEPAAVPGVAPIGGVASDLGHGSILGCEQQSTVGRFADRLSRWLRDSGAQARPPIGPREARSEGEAQRFSSLVDKPEAGGVRDTGRDRRRHPRHRAGWPARCIDQTGAGWSCWVADSSSGGLGLDGCPPLEVDQVIDVALDQIGSFSCRVAWSSGNRCGVAFLLMSDEFSSADVERLAGLLAAPRDFPSS